jgi:hypothetical protein
MNIYVRTSKNRKEDIKIGKDGVANDYTTLHTHRHRHQLLSSSQKEKPKKEVIILPYT